MEISQRRNQNSRANEMYWCACMAHGMLFLFVLCCFAIFSHDPARNDSNYVLVRLTIAAEAFVVVVAGITGILSKNHVESGNYYANKLLFTKCLYYRKFDFECAYAQQVGDQLCTVLNTTIT